MLETINSIVGELSSPGKGRKICDNCSEYIGARTKICKCGFSFEDGSLGNKVAEKVISVSKVFDGPGRGRRQCTSCKRYVGARSIECPICGVEIKSSSQKEENLENCVYKDENEDHYISTSLELSEEIKFMIAVGLGKRAKMIYAPSGACPFKLNTCDKESVANWSNKVLQSGVKQGFLYLPQAIKYWLRFQFPIGTKEYESGSRYIDEWSNELQDANQMLEAS